MNIKHLFGSLLVAATVAVGTAEIASANSAYIRGQDYGSRVTLRSGPSTQTQSLGYGLVGQDVDVLESFFNRNDGYTWNKVYFYESGAIGWMRGDFIGFYTPSH